MKTFTTVLLASAFMASPALACSFNKSASYEKPMVTASKAPEKTHTAISTFDPATTPKFEDKVEVTKEVKEAPKKIVSE